MASHSLHQFVQPSAADLVTLSDGDAFLTGPELVDAVLLPLATSALLDGRLHVRHEVVAVARSGMSRTFLLQTGYAQAATILDALAS